MDEISGKLDQIQSVLETIGLASNPVGSTSRISHNQSSVLQGTWTPASSSVAVTAKDDVGEADSEGEASLKTHAAHAAELVQRMVDGACAGVTPGITSSLDALRNIVQTNKQCHLNAGDPPAVHSSETPVNESVEMPPLDIAMKCLGMLKGTYSTMFSWLCHAYR